MEDDIITPSPQPSPVPDQDSTANLDSDGGSERIFDITDDLNISPAVDTEPKIMSKPVVPQSRPAYTPSVPTQIPQPKPAVPAGTQPIQPRKPAAIPLADFSASLEKAKTINMGGSSSADFTQTGKLPTEIGKDPVTQNPNIKPLRTYEGDVAEVLSHNKTSKASIAIAEAKKEGGEERIEDDEPSHAGKKLVLAILSLLLIGGGAAGAYYFYSRSPLAAVTPQTPASQPAPSLIPTDSQEVLPVNGLSPTTVLSRIRGEVVKSGTPNTIVEIIPVQSSDNQSVRVNTQDMLSLMEVTPPDILARSLTQNWMLGMYADASGSRTAFVVVTTNFFQNAFAGMLQWENVMADDLKQYLITGSSEGIANVAQQPVAVVASTTASSTTPVMTPAVPSSTLYSVQGHFVDRIIMNKDVRAFQTNDGKTLFLYSFIDNNRLVITGNEATLSEILTRLEKQAFIR